jgi:hypothetical protein
MAHLRLLRELRRMAGRGAGRRENRANVAAFAPAMNGARAGAAGLCGVPPGADLCTSGGVDTSWKLSSQAITGELSTICHPIDAKWQQVSVFMPGVACGRLAGRPDRG